ncbi:MAG: 2-oxoacid:acceptor oxidoreductase family protein [Microthrixaceae bacterium]
MVAAVFDELAAEHPRRRFTVGITDDVTHLSLPVDDPFDIEADDVTRAVFYGLGADGTVSSNKAAIRIIGDATDLWCQGHFVYDSKKSGATTVSHLRFGPRPIRSTYQIRRAGFVAVHDPGFLERLDVLDVADAGATVLINTTVPPEQVWDSLPIDAQQLLVERRCRLYAIDAYRIAEEHGLGRRINTVMSTCFFALSGVLPRDEAIAAVKAVGRGHVGQARPRDRAPQRRRDRRHPGRPPRGRRWARPRRPSPSPCGPDGGARLRRERHPPAARGPRRPAAGERVPARRHLAHRHQPLREAGHRHRDPDLGAGPVRAVQPLLDDLPPRRDPHQGVRTRGRRRRPEQLPPRARGHTPSSRASSYVVQVAPDDCTGCGLCVEVCPAKDRSSRDARPSTWRPLPSTVTGSAIVRVLRVAARRGSHPDPRRVPDPGRCCRRCSSSPEPAPGAARRPYLRLLTQLFGDRLVIANATGCSSIYGGNLPTTPYTTGPDGRGPAWNNSLFEDNAEFGLGIRLGVDAQEGRARLLLGRLRRGAARPTRRRADRSL